MSSNGSAVIQHHVKGPNGRFIDGPITQRFAFSARNAGTLTRAREIAEQAHASGWVRDMGGVRGFVQHEFGHALDLAGGRGGAACRHDVLWHMVEEKGLANVTTALKPTLGDYAFTNADEFFAEAFRAAHNARLPASAEWLGQAVKQVVGMTDDEVHAYMMRVWEARNAW